MQTTIPKRKNIRKRDYDYSQNGAYFVTICINNTQHQLCQIVTATCAEGKTALPCVRFTALGEIVDAVIRGSNCEGISILKYVIMPDHVHLIVAINATENRSLAECEDDNRRFLLQSFVRSMKAYASKQCGFSPWQKSFHDRIIRNEREYQTIWRYIDENPSRLVEDQCRKAEENNNANCES